MTRQFEYNWYRTLKQLERQIRLHPLNLGGVSTSGGGAGGPPGGYIGVLPQTRVAYDTSELETLATASGSSLVDNLNHIRYRINAIEESYVVQQGAFTVLGNIEVESNPIKMVNHTGDAKVISGVYLDIGTPPSGSDIIVDINNGGITIFTDQDNRPRISDGNSSGYTNVIDLSDWLDSEYLTMDVDQVGSGIAGSDLTVTVVYY